MLVTVKPPNLMILLTGRSVYHCCPVSISFSFPQPDPVSGLVGRRLPVRPHGRVPLLQVGDAVFLLVAQPHYVELPDAVALRAVDQPLAVGRSRRVVVHRPGRPIAELLALAVERDAIQFDVTALLGGVEDGLA